MYTYDAIETDKDSIDLSKMIRTICYLQDDNKQDAMFAVEIDNQLYLFYKAPYQSNADYLEAFKVLRQRTYGIYPYVTKYEKRRLIEDTFVPYVNSLASIDTSV